MKSLSIIIPCYNFEKLILSNIKKIQNKISKYSIKYEIIVVDDGSQDTTYKKLLSLKKNIKLKILKNSKNRGKSYSVRKALNRAKYDHVILLDCDLPYFKVLEKIIKKLKKNKDIVIVNRGLKKSKLKNKNLTIYQFFRLFVGKLLGLFFKSFFKLNMDGGDTQAGLKGFKKYSFVVKYNFLSKRFFFDLELLNLFSKKNKKISSLPVTYEPPKDSTIKFFDKKIF